MINNQFIYSSSEFARQLGITRDCLRSRRRRGWHKDHFIEKDGKFLFRKWEGQQPNQKKLKNRGAHDDAVKQGRYPNKAMEEHNAMKRLLAAKKQLTKKELDLVPQIMEGIKNITDNNEVVYFITYFDPLIKDEDRLIKIGKTKERTVTSRFSGIQSSCPFELTLLTYSKANSEKFFHDKFKEHHVRGEWFKYIPVLEYLKKEHEEDYFLPDTLLNTMKERIDGEYVSGQNDKDLCNVWFKLKTSEKLV